MPVGATLPAALKRATTAVAPAAKDTLLKGSLTLLATRLCTQEDERLRVTLVKHCLICLCKSHKWLSWAVSR
jgi:hypothetical protein